MKHFYHIVEWRVPEGDPEWRIFLKNTLILAFDWVRLGGFRITSKTKINIYWKNFSTPGPLWKLSIRKNFKKRDFSLWGKQYIVLPKWTFFRILAHCCGMCGNLQIEHLEWIMNSIKIYRRHFFQFYMLFLKSIKNS